MTITGTVIGLSLILFSIVGIIEQIADELMRQSNHDTEL